MADTDSKCLVLCSRSRPLWPCFKGPPNTNNQRGRRKFSRPLFSSFEDPNLSLFLSLSRSFYATQYKYRTHWFVPGNPIRHISIDRRRGGGPDHGPPFWTIGAAQTCILNITLISIFHLLHFSSEGQFVSLLFHPARSVLNLGKSCLLGEFPSLFVIHLTYRVF